MHVCLFLCYEEFEDTKGVFRICKWEKNRQYNDQMKKDENANNVLQNTRKTKDRVTTYFMSYPLQDTMYYFLYMYNTYLVCHCVSLTNNSMLN